MRILAIETATSLGGVALLEDSDVVAQLTELVPRQHLEWLAPAIARLLAAAGWVPARVDAVTVSTGPGSFTSLRIGIATAAMWARARGIPAVGVSTLAAVAMSTQAHGLILPILDVRRGEVAAALFARDGGLRRMTEDTVGPVAQVLEKFPGAGITFSGDALTRYAETVAALRPGASLARRADWYPTAAAVGRLGWERLARGEHDDLYRLWPVYVRAPVT